MTQKTKAFKVGLFVIVGIILTISGIVFLGAHGWQGEYIYVETYIDESVQGLEVGAPVKYRGVQIGIVTRIDFVDRKYPEIRDSILRKVLVELGIYPETFDDLSNVEIHHRLETEAQKGLRVKLKSQGLTGLAYIEADYLDPTSYPPMNISWNPEFCYVPYTPSLSAQLQESADSINVILRNLRDVNLGDIAADLNSVILTVQEVLDKWQVGSLMEESIGLVRGLKTTNEALKKKIEEAQVGELANEIRGAANTFTRSIQDLNLKEIRLEVSASLSEFQSTTRRLKELLEKEEIEHMASDLSISLSAAKRILGSAEPKVTELLEALRLSSNRFYKTTKKLDHILSDEQPNVESIFENLKIITDDLRDLTHYVKKYPSHAIFGEPPPREEFSK